MLQLMWWQSGGAMANYKSCRFSRRKKKSYYKGYCLSFNWQGVQRTRRFLLEWLSFMHRYIPVGLLERLPQRINERPPYFTGRDDLETLMTSANCADWIKIRWVKITSAPLSFFVYRAFSHGLMLSTNILHYWAWQFLHELLHSWSKRMIIACAHGACDCPGYPG